jgi:hypothetical protein
MIPVKPKRGTIEEVGGFVTIHVALPPQILKKVVKAARQEGHRDVSLVICRALEGSGTQPSSAAAEKSNS